MWYNVSMKQEASRTLNKKMLERIIIIHNAIKSGIYPNNEQLRRLYCEQTGYSNVGEATINRDIDMLRTYFRAPLEYDRSKGGYYYLDDRWDFALNTLSSQEVFYLSAAKTLLSAFTGTPLYNAISDVIDFITDTQTAGKSELLKRIAVPPTPQLKTNETIWQEILRAMQSNRIIEFDYNGRWRTQTTHRRVHPYQFLFDDGMCFLFGYSEEREAERLFLLNRMKNLSVTDEQFQLPKNYEFSSRCGGGKFGAFMTEDAEWFSIDFYGTARQYVKDCVWADDQEITDFESEDRTRIQFSSTQALKVREWILSQGQNAVPREPEWFVEDWKSQVREMAKRAGIKEAMGKRRTVRKR